MSDPTDCAFSIAAMVKDWYASPHKSDIPATLIDRRMTRFEPSPALAVLAMRERAASLVETTAYTTQGEKRSLEPVSKALEGCDSHHATIALTIRALPTTFTNAELLAAAMQLPEVRALVEAADDLNEAISATDIFGDRSLTITATTANLKWLINAEDAARAALAALAPFMKGAS